MATTDVIELHSSSSDDDFQEPPRKHVWSDQGNKNKAKMATPRSNGATTSTSASSSPSASRHTAKASDDELEIIEVKATPNSKLSSLASSSRSDIRKQLRGVTQSSISNFFSSQKKVTEDDDKKGSKKENDEIKKLGNSTGDEEEEEEEEEKNKSAACMEDFLGRWEEINVSKDDERIRDKIWKHYYLAQTSYTHSKRFIQILESSTRKLTVANIYVVIKDILDCLKRYKDIPCREKGSGDESVGPSGEGTPIPLQTEDPKTNSRLRKVEKKMKELADKIKQLQNEDVDLEDEDNSSYLVEDRLKRQFAKLHDYYCRLANCSSATGRPIEKKFKYRGSRWMEINKRITAWVNKHKEFPDYVDVLNLVKKVTKQSSLPLRPETVRVQAQEIFREVGRMLKCRRESDDMYSLYSYADEDAEDPATQNPALNNQLNENEKLAVTNLAKVFQEYVDKDAEQREAADCTTDKATTSETPTKPDSPVKSPVKSPIKSPVNSPIKSPVKSPSRIAKCPEEETSMTEGDNDVNEDIESETSTVEPPVIQKSVDNCTEEERNTANGHVKEIEEYTISDTEDDVSSGNTEDSEKDDDTSSNESEEGDMENSLLLNDERVKVEELDEGDETDDDLKVVLASACMEEEEEDSEEDISIMDTEEVLTLDDGDETDNKNSPLSQSDEIQEIPTTTSTTAHNATDHLPTALTAQDDATEQLSTTTVDTSPDASENTTTTDAKPDTSENTTTVTIDTSLDTSVNATTTAVDSLPDAPENTTITATTITIDTSPDTSENTTTTASTVTIDTSPDTSENDTTTTTTTTVDTSSDTSENNNTTTTVDTSPDPSENTTTTNATKPQKRELEESLPPSPCKRICISNANP